MNTFGERFRITTFGESHGLAIGCIIDGIPAGLFIDEEFIAEEMSLRKGGKNKFSTPRKESDRVEILSGVFEGRSTGTPIALIIANEQAKSKDYQNIKSIFRPAHADWSYMQKYGIRDYRGGGRSSARETAARVASGAIAKLLLKEVDIVIESGVYAIGEIEAKNIDFGYSNESEIFTLDKDMEENQKELIIRAKKNRDSVGGVVIVRAKRLKENNTNFITGLGEPLYHKLDGAIGGAMMGLNGVKAVEIGDGIWATKTFGSQNNDEMNAKGFLSNHAGGILGGISSGQDIIVKVYFKPTPSIFLPQKTIDVNHTEVICELQGRHDPCIAVRGSIICGSMLALVLADMLLLNTSSRIENIHKIYH